MKMGFRGINLKLIVGLGNPGKQYEDTRHNIGFKVIDELSSRLMIPIDKAKFNGAMGMGLVSGEKVLLLKPLTYMNLSGECIRPIMDYYNIDIEDLIVVYDDLDLPTGKIRLRSKGSAGGHNGIKSTIQHLGTQQFKRVRIGIDRPKNGMKVPDYVLGRFSEEEIDSVVDSVKLSASACEKWLSTPFLQVMNEYNS
ncbi:aminoacyl-tRNA hydrolase [Bacillus timonensis]|nr:aminoacyl-tRNA hydrolase [Bacillus timonensis]